MAVQDLCGAEDNGGGIQNHAQKQIVEHVFLRGPEGLIEGVRVGVGLQRVGVVGVEQVVGHAGGAPVPEKLPAGLGVQLQGLLGGLRLLGAGGAQPVPPPGLGDVHLEQDHPEGAGGQDTPPGEVVEEQPLGGHALQPGLRAGDVLGVHHGPFSDQIAGGFFLRSVHRISSLWKKSVPCLAKGETTHPSGVSMAAISSNHSLRSSVPS